MLESMSPGQGQHGLLILFHRHNPKLWGNKKQTNKQWQQQQKKQWKKKVTEEWNINNILPVMQWSWGLFVFTMSELERQDDDSNWNRAKVVVSNCMISFKQRDKSFHFLVDFTMTSMARTQAKAEPGPLIHVSQLNGRNLITWAIQGWKCTLARSWNPESEWSNPGTLMWDVSTLS